METHVLTFTITKSFSEWAKAYDASVPLQKIAGIKSLYRGVSKENPDQVCAVMQAEPGVMEQFMADHTEIIVASGHVCWKARSIRSSSRVDGLAAGQSLDQPAIGPGLPSLRTHHQRRPRASTLG